MGVNQMFNKSLRLIMLILAVVTMVVFFVAAVPASAASISVNPTSGGLGTTFTIYADGFQSKGLVDTWVTRADGKTIGLGTVRANSAGQVSFSITPQLGWPSGEYIAVAHARTGGLQLFVKFGLNAPPPPAGASSGGTTPAAPAGMSVQPTSGNNNTTFILTAGGFNVGEPVLMWVTAPDLSIAGAGTVIANSSGVVQLAGKLPSTSLAGKYTAYARGQFSGHQYSATFTYTVPTYPDWKGEYFNNQNLSGSPVLVRNDPSINFNWGLGSPDSSVSSDHFSVRWTRNQFFSAGTYQFTVTTDDGMRLWVGDTLLIDAWYDQSATHTATITLSAGTYPLRVEYYEDNGNAVAQVSWSTTITPSLQPWTGYYYNNTSLSGTPVLIRQDANLNFNWGGGSPGAGVPGTNWSAKWDSSQYAASSGNYTVSVTADDGVRVWVDGNLIIDEWQDQPPTTFSATGYLAAGWHSVHVEYYQHVGGSMIQLGFVQD
jgi:hypothetical protein